MSLLAELLKKILFLVPVFIILLFLYLLIRFTLSALGMNVSIAESYQKYKKEDYLPPPGSFGVLPSKVAPPTGEATNPSMEYFNPGMNTQYPYRNYQSYYTSANSEIQHVSVWQDGVITSGQIISGEAKASFFENEKFYVRIDSENGAPIVSSYAFAMEDPEGKQWVKWRAQIGYLGKEPTPCTLLLSNRNLATSALFAKIVKIPALCAGK